MEAVKTCKTCLYMATHENCNGCLGGNGEYLYKNHRAGNWLGRVMLYELTGRHNIVIGGQGEAEINTNWTIDQAARSLHNVAEQCGYMAGQLRPDCLIISTSEGTFQLVWKDSGFNEIIQCNYEGTPKKSLWNRDTIANQLEEWHKSDDPLVNNFADGIA